MTRFVYINRLMTALIHNCALRPICMLLIVSISFSGYGGVLCIGGDGHVNLESHCQPWSCDGHEPCSVVGSDDMHDHHDHCVNRSHVPLDGSDWLAASSIAGKKTVQCSTPAGGRTVNTADTKPLNNSICTRWCENTTGLSIGAVLSTTVLRC